MSPQRPLFEESPRTIYWDVNRPAAPAPRTATPPTPASSHPTVSPMSTPGPTSASIRRSRPTHSVTDRTPVSPIIEHYGTVEPEYEPVRTRNRTRSEGEAIELREAAAAGVPFLDMDETPYAPPAAAAASRNSARRAWDAPGMGIVHRMSRGLAAKKEEGVLGRTGTGVTDAEDEAAELGATWRPVYLTKRILVGFTVIFLAMIVVVEILAGVDENSDGLGRTNSRSRALWMYGPPAILTLTTVFWTRVEFQARRFLPWIYLAGKEGRPVPRDASETLLIDYANMWLPKALYLAVARRHLLVALPIVTSILLIVQIVLSAGFFTVQELRTETGGSGNLRARADFPAVAEIIVEDRRLRVAAGVAHTMAVFFAIAALLAGWLALVVPSHGIAPRNPNSLASTAGLLKSSPGIFGRLRHVDHTNPTAVAERFEGLFYTEVEDNTAVPPYMKRFVFSCLPDRRDPEERRRSAARAQEAVEAGAYRPLVLHPAVRIVGMVITIGMAAALWGTIAHSNEHRGLGNVKHTQTQAAAWTIVPALFFMVLAVYLWTVDFEIRFGAPFLDIFSGSHFRRGMTTTYTDELAPATLYKAVRGRNWRVLVTKTAAILAAWGPILAAGLFSPETVWTTALVQLSGADSALAGRAEQTAWVREGLVIPRVVMASAVSLAEGESLSVTLPAYRAELECEAPVSGAGWKASDMECEYLETVEGDPTCSQSVESERSSEEAGSFAYVAVGCRSKTTGEALAATVHYVWGTCGMERGRQPTYQAMVLACNETISQMSVSATMRGPGLSLEGTPTIIPQTGRIVDLASPLVQDIYGGYEVFTKAFVPSNLDTSDDAGTLSAAIQKRHTLLRAQILAALPPPPPPSPTSSHQSRARDADQGQTPAFQARAATSTTRLVQRAAPTYALAVLLTVIFILEAAGLWLEPQDANPIPGCPGSIAGAAAMLGTWEVFSRLPEGAEWVRERDLGGLFPNGDGARARS